ncbi:1,6-dihydroxycyclohexa-2,4-diene-1-carboxylate dehydrogenase [Corynebacterium ammoniagenes]|uniref:1,6-dihydroxycyclohexa-2,4-diene-1-carboxylate dehydrogenase n=2 Tax=Corynebacterium ammoniagenes TaxID=1697 RepID=A0AAV5G7V5_CORAM|nr:1,6-dihydroxycyclohexa-2,4-diene-1-carboxylate dehydrogenase [Corynebacterium ammoniagenes]APT83672.1 1,6-dihydroxycyclohexa-2,4-diene-1-carboxylate dehydrogenase [Corynebacterium ammoniagenes DSM 20306]AQS74655.1 1,6-dihydroxycyclohexa-2,4-diene-1-carboxylate dehydrogenase [Corynebacterium ammoniagenes]EFG81674.1 oxidoreductase, short chain dehydrogenase/reductase family protein [Corynebacterium ammoniagenes DSM 20306]NMF32725.1 1,6-dihydroxycyclohexa-2,4-diene-1-carboxylate dehydrogenase [
MTMPVGGAADEQGIFTPQRFKDQVVIVTGAAQGIGFAVAQRIAREDGTVVLVDRADLVHERAEQLAGTGAGQTYSTTADLETFAGAQSAVDFALAKAGRVDVLINNVGGTIWAKPYEHYTPEEIEKEINRSLFPTLWMCRAVLPALIDAYSGKNTTEAGSQQGVIVNVSSTATGGINRVPYAAAKGGVNGIVSALAHEAAHHNVRIVAAAPGGTLAPARAVQRGPLPDDEQEKQWYQQIVDQTVDSSLMKRYGTLDEQTAPICFLASREASYITGSVLPVSGGDQG